ncbi:hypothetical protein [Sphingomonas solaris]|uniref:Uncharacterized protein n=1 Tax=Alterirhizorhabdus solaris TaxID=2529389 RepID=A0A558R3U3_9SPHN|nr:hypothetical protein [Sphingomonas solaris]TVV74041.1 hypothetical protein FOY91_10800 [Sphingomonas solaris]
MRSGAGKRAPRLVAIVAVLVIVAALATELFVMRATLADTRQEAAALREWQAAILAQIKRGERSTGGAGKGSRLDPAEAPEALAELISQRDTAIEVMRLSSSAGRTAGQGTSRPAGIGPNSIGRLRGRESSGIAGQDVSAIEDDSKAAWGGWQ